MKSRFLLFLASCLLWTGVAFAQININTASQDELDGLKGIGPTKAKAIVDYRKKNGSFKSVDDLQKVPGIGPATLKDLRADVTVSGASRSPVVVPAAPARMTNEMAKPAGPAVPGKGMAESRPVPNPAPVQAKPAAPAVPAKPAMPGTPSAEAKPAAPAVPVLKPAAPAPASPMAKPAAPASPVARPIPPARPAAPARPALPAAVN